jgi:hypothetical protein
MEKLSKNLFYRPKSHYLLNHLTLSIKDAEIHQSYREALGQNFDKLFWTSVIVTLLHAMIRVVSYFASDYYPPARIVTSAM